MKRIVLASFVITAYMASHAALQVGDNVIWYKATTNAYNLQANAGPNLPASVAVSEGKVVTCSDNNQGFPDPSFGLGNGSSHAGYCWSSAILSHDLCDPVNKNAVVDAAVFRVEARDVVSGASGPFCNPGNIHLKIGVCDVSNGVSAYGSIANIEENATWSSINASTNIAYANAAALIISGTELDTAIVSPTGRNSNSATPLLDSVFFSINVKAQVQWILNNAVAGQYYAIVILAEQNDTDVGRFMGRGDETCNHVLQSGGPDNGQPVLARPWSADDNTAHFFLHVTQVAVENNGAAANGEAASVNAMPNPFNPSTSIAYNTGKIETGALAICNAAGTQVFGAEVRGAGTLTWNAETMAAGVYFCALKIGTKTVSKRLVLIR